MKVIAARLSVIRTPTEPAALAIDRWQRTIRGPEEDVVIGSHILCQLGRVAACVLAISLSITPGLAAGDSNEAWTALVKGGHVALIRHGNAPPGYGGDPPGFKIDDCKTQRNLDEQGRGEARGGFCPRLGAAAWRRPASWVSVLLILHGPSSRT